MKIIALFFVTLLWAPGLLRVANGQSPTQPLTFQVSPSKPIFSAREDVVLHFSLRNRSKDTVFVSRKMYSEFVDLTILGPDGKEVTRRGKSKIDSKNYSPQEFAVLKEGETVSAESVVSLKNGLGFAIQKPGRYRIRAEYSLGPPAYFAPFAGAAKVPEGTFRSKTASFCVEACAATSEPKP